jgi:hypothetical protein
MNSILGAAHPRMFALLLMGACGLYSAPARADWQEVLICNKGTIEVAVAWAQETRLLVAIDFWESEGWQWIDVDACKRVWLGTTDGMAIMHIVLAGRAPNGTFGVLPRRLELRDIPNRKSSLCVRYDAFDIGKEVLPPCSAPYVEVPTAGSFVVAGREYSLTATTRPQASDYQSMVAINGPAPTGTHAAAPPPTPAPYFRNDNTGDFWGSLAAAANEELERRQQAQRAPQAQRVSPPPPLPPSPPKIGEPGWVEESHAVVRAVDNSCRTAGRRADYCGCVSDAVGFGAGNEYVEALITTWDDRSALIIAGRDKIWEGNCSFINEISAPLRSTPDPVPDARPAAKACVPSNDNIFECVR